MPYEYNEYLTSNSRELRKNMTPEENHLWYDFLKKLPVVAKRQYGIENYIVDFFIPSAKIAIELDGSQHYTKLGKAHDEARTEILEKYGIYVLRFSNKDIDENFDGVCRMIDRVINERIENLP